MNRESGFTLVELLTVMAILGVLVAIALQTVGVYKAQASYAVAEETLHDARVSLEAGLSEADAAHPTPINFVRQEMPGAFLHPNANALFPGFRIPKNVAVTVYHDPSCLHGACLSKLIEVRHCSGADYIQWERMGDGVEIKVDHIDGSGC